MNEMKEKKISWNISKAMSSVYQSLNGSKLKIKKTKAYSAAMEKLKALYNINQIQVWILCLACERYFEREDSISLQNISEELGVPVMSIICWKKIMNSSKKDSLNSQRKEIFLKHP